MACCGQPVTGRLTITQKDIDNGLALELEYQGGPTMKARGPVTGKSYVFSCLKRVEKVDPRDAPGMLRDSRFRLKGIARANS